MGLACVLMLEDDAGIRLVMAEILREAGYEVVAVETVGQALSLLEGQAGAAVRIMVVDLTLQDASGSAFLKAVRRMPRFQTVPAILATGAVRGEVRFPPPASYQALLRKPYRPSALLELVGRLLAEGRADAPGGIVNGPRHPAAAHYPDRPS
jgi:CheY-like chemotaxis protein